MLIWQCYAGAENGRERQLRWLQ